MDNFTCSLNHPFYDILSNKTRLEILRMLICERNYGSRIASILKMSPPAVHRHLKYLSQSFKCQNMTEINFIKPSYKTTESFSGYKGAEATMYELGTKIFLTFAFYPNFVHSHIFHESLDIDVKEPQIITGSLKSNDKKNRIDENDTTRKQVIKKFIKLYKQVQKKNEQIDKLEREIIEVFEEKNELMKEIDKTILEVRTLDFDERVSLRGLACQGSRCVPNLPELIKQDEEIAYKILQNLKNNGWFESLDEQFDF